MVTQNSPARNSLFAASLRGILAAIMLCAVATAANATEYDGAVQKCIELLPAFDRNPTNIRTEVQPAIADRPVGVRVTWTRSDAPSGDPEGWIVCFFLPRAETGGAWQIDGMDTQKYGRMRRYDVQQLYKLRWINENYLTGPQQAAPPAVERAWLVQSLYILQQMLNAITLGCLYAMLAVAFTIVYNVTRIVNLAFGDLYMIGAFVTYVSYVLVAAGGASFSVPVVTLALLVTIGVCALASWTTNRLAFSHMRRGPTTVPMIASIGIAIVFREAVRLAQGPKTRWMPPTKGTVWQLTEGLGYDVYLRKGHLMIGLATLVVAALMWWAGRHTTFGRGYRAAAQDPRMAELLGVNVGHMVGFAFLVAGGMTGIAGIFAALQYQLVDFYMGYVIGFKALAAALLGGIGSLGGAFLGGILIAAIEVFGGMALGDEWRDLAVFATMALVLIFRPSGLFGTLKNTPADERV
jgi:branched-chain amino acid transport system permease protein